MFGATNSFSNVLEKKKKNIWEKNKKEELNRKLPNLIGSSSRFHLITKVNWKTTGLPRPITQTLLLLRIIVIVTNTSNLNLYPKNKQQSSISNFFLFISAWYHQPFVQHWDQDWQFKLQEFPMLWDWLQLSDQLFNKALDHILLTTKMKLSKNSQLGMYY